MAITSSTIHHKESSFRINNESGHVWTYFLTTDTDYDPYDVKIEGTLATPNPLPSEYQVHPSDNDAYVLDISIQHREENDFKQWQAVVTYGKIPDGTSGQSEENPLDWDTKYSLDFKMVSRQVLSDAHGNPILNTARQPVARPPRIDYQVPIIVARKWYRTLDEIVQFGNTFDQTVNNDDFRGAQPGQAQFESIRASAERVFNAETYHEATISVAVDYRATDVVPILVDNLGWEAWDRPPDWSEGDDALFAHPDGDYLVWKPPPGTAWTNPENAAARLNTITGDNDEPLGNPVHLTVDGRQSGEAKSTTDPPVRWVAYDVKRPVAYARMNL